MGQREQTYKVKLIVNPDTPFSKIRTLFPTGRDDERAKAKVKKFGRIISCVKYVSGGFDEDSFIKKVEFINKKKGDVIVDTSFTLNQANEFNNKVVIEDSFTVGKELRLQRIERKNKEKQKTIAQMFDEEDND